MPHYLVVSHLPENFDPSSQDEAMVRAISDLNDELEAAGARVFVGGLSPTSEAKSLRAQPNGEVLVTDGPYLEAKEHVGGFSILEAADMDEVLMWARKSVIACRMPVEVREIPYSNLPNGTPHPSRQRGQKP
ncbi:MAG TPA: YciI family protein [Thermoanaerobaculia bacterium]|nr:YciI family protein [Thermoanaerobaculia bacterium]